MKRLIYTSAAALLLCACGTKQTQQQCPYQEDSFPIHGSVLKNVDSMEYYNALAAQGDARAQYIMAASYYCSAEAQPLPVGITRVLIRCSTLPQIKATSLPSKRASASASVEVNNYYVQWRISRIS